MGRNRFPVAWLWCFVVVAAGGCGDRAVELQQHTGALEATRVAFDLVERWHAAERLAEEPFIDVGSEIGARALVSGWGDREVDPDSGASFAWAVADRAVIETTLFDARADRLVLRCRPFTWDGALEQRIAITVNGREVGEVVLSPGLSDYSVVLPSGILEIGTNRVELRFSWTATPAGRVPGSTDERSLAAAVEWLGFGITDPPQSTPASDAGPRIDDGELVIPAGVGLRYRLTVPTDAVLDLGVSTRPAAAAGVRGVVWVARPGKGTMSSIPLVPSESAGERVRIVIEAGAGEIVELGVAAVAAGGGGGDLVLHTPRILGSEGGTRELASVLLIVVDTLRSDYLGCYGADVATPNIDALAAAGVRFTDARSHIPITGPSHASLFTSLLPMEHGVRNNAQELSDRFPTLAESLRSAGRQTSAVISLGVMQGVFGFDRGFDSYGDRFPRDWTKDASEVTDEVLELVEQGLSNPYFLWVHYSDPHEPYAPTHEVYPRFELRLDGRSVGWIDARGRGFRFDVTLPDGDSVLEFVPLDELEPGRVFRVDNLLVETPSVEIEALDGWNVIPRRMDRTTYESSFPASVKLANSTGERLDTQLFVSCKKLLSKPEIREAYAKETEFVDQQLGRLLRAFEDRGLLDNTLVVFLSDHGEGLGDHNHIGHISQLYDSLLRVPLVLTWAHGLPEGVVIEEPVSLVDVFPTIADLLGLTAPLDASGVSLTPLIRGAHLPHRPLIAATYRPEAASDKLAIMVDGFKYIRSWTDERDWEELYNVVEDPGELENLSEERPERLQELSQELGRRLAGMSESSSIEAELSETDRAHLRALGYIH